MAESRDKSNKIITIGDQPATKDELGFTPYVIAIAEFLTHNDTKPPLTISIEGEWGSGKSSFMKQLDAEIKNKSKELDREDSKKIWQKIKQDGWSADFSDIYKFLRLKLKQETQTVWFNAWRHEKSESLWATFALSFLEQLSKNRNFLDFLYNSWSQCLLLRKRFDFQDKPFKAIQTLAISSLIFSIILAIPFVYWKVGVERIPQLSETLAELVKTDSKEEEKNQNLEGQKKQSEKNKSDNQESESTNNEGLNNLLLSISAFLGLTGGSVAAIGKLLGIIRDLIGDNKMDLTQYLQSPDYEKEAAFIEKFHEDFSKIVSAYVGKDEKIYVFIDDLDRCELGKSADLLQALNMMISNDPNIIFILGMDREKVAAAITFKQKNVIPFLASIARENQDEKNGNDKLSKQIDYGFSFLEKFVQLSFSVPAASQNTLNNFVEKISEHQTEIYQEKRFFWIPYSLIAESFDLANILATLIFKELVKPVGNKLLSQKAIADEYDFCLLAIAQLLNNQYSRLLDFYFHTLIQQNSQKELSEKVEVQPLTIEENLEFQQTDNLAIFPIIEKDLDEQSLAEAVEIVGDFFDNNPRRLKQYINALKLTSYITYYAIGVTFDEKNTVTIEQISKFTALTLKYPRLLLELKNNPNLLADLEKYASNNSIILNHQSTPNNQEKGNANYWVGNYPKIKQLLSSEIKKINTSPNNKQKIYDKHVFQNSSIKKLLQVSPQGISPQYFKLRKLLAAGKWKKANDETFSLIFQAPNIEKVYRNKINSYLSSKAITLRLEKVELKLEIRVKKAVEAVAAVVLGVGMAGVGAGMIVLLTGVLAIVEEFLFSRKYVLLFLLEAIYNFPSDDFRTIDLLWEKYSNGKFGFRVQKQIYKQIFVNSNQTQQYNQELWNKFGEEVGWRKGDNWSLYDDPKFELQSMKKGELPRLWTSGQKISIGRRNFQIKNEEDNNLCKSIFHKNF
ncbi:MAG: P-loop NTPase fold protein [Microcoleaceae cyanobacterium]